MHLGKIIILVNLGRMRLVRKYTLSCTVTFIATRTKLTLWQNSALCKADVSTAVSRTTCTGFPCLRAVSACKWKVQDTNQLIYIDRYIWGGVVCVCVCVCVHVCMHAYVHACMCGHVHARTCMYMFRMVLMDKWNSSKVLRDKVAEHLLQTS